MNAALAPASVLTELKNSNQESLQAFQQRLSAKIQAAQAQSSMELLRLHVRVQGRSLLLALPETNQVVEPSKLLPIPLTQAWLLGLTSVRGELTSVVDLSCWLGWGAAAPTATSRWVILAASLGAPCAIAVDAVLGLVNVNAGLWRLAEQETVASAPELAWLQHERKQSVAAGCWGGAYQQTGDSVTKQAANLFACDFSVSKMTQLAAFVNTERR